MIMPTGTPKNVHRRTLFAPKVPVDCRPNTKRVVYLLFHLRVGLTDEIRWDCTFHCITGEIYAAVAGKEKVRLRTRG